MSRYLLDACALIALIVTADHHEFDKIEEKKSADFY